MSSTNRISIGWVLVSYFMITGGFLFAASLLGIARVEGEWVGYGVFFLGAACGGFFAGRASPGKTIIEPAIAGGLFILAFLGLFSMVPGSRAVISAAGGTILMTSLKIGFITALGGLVGAMVGERSAPPQRSNSRLRWMGLAGLVSLGTLFTLTLLIGVLMMRSGDISDGTGPVLLILSSSAFLGGWVTQSIAPERMCLVAGSGFMVVGLTSIGLAVAQGAPLNGSLILGGLIFGGVGTLVGALGARVAWGVSGERIERVAAAERAGGGDLPSARVQ